MEENKDILQEYIDNKIVIRNGSWYNYINGDKNIQLGKGKEEAQMGLLKLLTEQNETIEQNENTSENQNLQPVKNNPKLNNENNESDNDNDIYGSMASDVGDISSRGKSGRFRVYINGIDSRLKQHPEIKKCPYVFRHNDIKLNIMSGKNKKNGGWTVFSKSRHNKINPKTGAQWLSVARDDSQEEDYYQVGGTVLCFASKSQFELKKGKMTLENIQRSGRESDKRMEQSKKMAELSKTNPQQSISGYQTSNINEQSKAKEHLTEVKGLTNNQAHEYINNMNNCEMTIEDQINNMKNLANQGKLSNSVTNVSPLKIDDI